LILEYKKNEEDLIESKATNFHRMRIFASRFHNEYSDLIITGGWDDTVRVNFYKSVFLNIEILKNIFL